MKYFTILIYLLLIYTLLISCNNKYPKNDKPSLRLDKSINKSTDTTSALLNKIDTKKNFMLGNYSKESDVLNSHVELIFNNLTDDERIGQMIITSCGKLGRNVTQVQKLIQKKKVGGVLLLGGSKNEFKEIIKRLNESAKEYSSLPLIFSVDAEPSLINEKISGVKSFNNTSSIRSKQKSKNIARDISKILIDIGINQNYAPVCDFPYNKEIIGNRSFGKDEQELAMLSIAFINEIQDNNIIATAKHFPGHGNVKGDSHKELVYINGDLKELPVFKEVIKYGVLSIMVGHIAIKNNKRYNTQGYPSTLSKVIVTDLLKEELGFNGIVITDAMNMGALNNFKTPSLNAVKAGCDMILMPSDETKLLNSIISEMDKDESLKDQVYKSVKKIIRIKICIGLI